MRVHGSVCSVLRKCSCWNLVLVHLSTCNSKPKFSFHYEFRKTKNHWQYIYFLPEHKQGRYMTWRKVRYDYSKYMGLDQTKYKTLFVLEIILNRNLVLRKESGTNKNETRNRTVHHWSLSLLWDMQRLWQVESQPLQSAIFRIEKKRMMMISNVSTKTKRDILLWKKMNM